ncbi:MAG: hypothetical protein VX589_03565 [Myxococcota bacterium]|nr:hypothetical protein [Myxococcota bacterium]
MVDGTIEQYRARLDGWIGPRAWAKSLETIEVSNKYVDGQPVYFPGLSVVSPPGPESPQWSTIYQPLVELREGILSDLPGSGHQSVPDESLHVTGADLIAGPRYLAQTKRVGDFDNLLAEQVNVAWAQMPATGRPLRWQFAGIAFFQHALVCLLNPVDKSDYDPLIHLRDLIYGCSDLAELGVRKTKPFMAHITLAYYTNIPPLPTRLSWLERCRLRQDTFDIFKVPFSLDTLEIRRFQDMTAYHLLESNRIFRFGAQSD